MKPIEQMTHEELVKTIVDYYNDHFKWQKFVYDEYIDEELVDKQSDEYLRSFIKENCND